jgi:hypothetical protein
MFNNQILPVESKMTRKTAYPNSTVVDVMCAAIAVHNQQGFVRSGQGYTDHHHTIEAEPIVTYDNKTVIINNYLTKNVPFTETEHLEASKLLDNINGKLMIKKMTNSLNNFEQSVAKVLNEADISNFAVSIIASLPHSIQIDKKREIIEDKMASLKHSSMYFGDKGKRYDITVEIMDVKFIQTSSIYMITSIYAKKDIIKFWWRDQPDISDIISNKEIQIRATVNKHELSKYTNARETMVNRVKIIKI